MRWLIVQPSQASCQSMYIAPSSSVTPLVLALPKLNLYAARCEAICADAGTTKKTTRAQEAISNQNLRIQTDSGAKGRKCGGRSGRYYGTDCCTATPTPLTY